MTAKFLHASMCGGDMLIQMTLVSKGFQTMLTNMFLDAIMHDGDMYSQISFLSK